MSHNQKLSRSTKRRRFLEEVEVVDLFRESSILVPLVSSLSQTNVLENYLQPSQHDQLSDSSNNSNFLINNFDKIEILDSESDSDSDTETLGIDFINNYVESILIILAQWAVAFNFSNIALSALLKNLKSHKCFNSFPVDARSILKTKLHNSPMNILSIPPGKYYHFGIANGLKNISNFIGD